MVGFFLCFSKIFAQEYSETDSLEQVFISKKYRENDFFFILKRLAKDVNNPQKKLEYSKLLLKTATEKDSIEYLFDAYIQIGNSLRLKGDLTEALQNFYKAAEIAKGKPNELELSGLTNITIADVYSVMEDHENAAKYYKNGIANLRESKADSLKLASALLNAGDEFLSADKYDEAMSFFYESSLISTKKGYASVNAYNLGNMGMVYAKQGKHDLARANIDEAITILEKQRDFYPIAVYLEFIANIYLDQNKPKLAKSYAVKSLELSKKYQLKEQITDASLKLAFIYELLNENNKALFHLKEHLTYKDSINNIASVQKMANIRTAIEVEKKQVEIDLINQREKTQKLLSIGIGIGLFLMSLIAFGLFRRNKYVKKTNKIIQDEKERSDKLLLNLLPEESANELKKQGYVSSKRLESVTVIFTDFKGFTKIAENLPAEKIVKSLDFYFSKFDDIVKKYNLEKIKTIGDAYMCASGLPTPFDNHAAIALSAAKEMLEFVKSSKQKHNTDEIRFDIRIGIHTGPVVAGVVGKDKFSYDIWGDTVNIASRVESLCEVGKINITNETYKLVKENFNFTERGEISIKNRSAIKMYYLKN